MNGSTRTESVGVAARIAVGLTQERSPAASAGVKQNPNRTANFAENSHKEIGNPCLH